MIPLYIVADSDQNLVLVFKMGSNEISDIKRKFNNNQKLSIVISGWPAVGKTTIAENLSKYFNLKQWNGGDILKMMAYERGYATSNSRDWWDTDDAINFMNERNNDPSFDKEVDSRLMELLNSGNVVITSYTLPWISDASINFWLQGSVDSRAKRMAMRDSIDINVAKKIVMRRDHDNKMIYKKLYNFDFGEKLDVFDFALNTDLLSLESLIDISKKVIEHVLRY